MEKKQKRRYSRKFILLHYILLFAIAGISLLGTSLIPKVSSLTEIVHNHIDITFLILLGLCMADIAVILVYEYFDNCFIENSLEQLTKSTNETRKKAEKEIACLQQEIENSQQLNAQKQEKILTLFEHNREQNIYIQYEIRDIRKDILWMERDLKIPKTTDNSR